MNINVQLFSAEVLLSGAPILDQINQICESLNYQTEDGQVSVGDYFNLLRKDIGNLKSFDLNSTIAPGTEYAYILSVTNTLQEVLDQLEQVSVKAVFFQSRLKSIQKSVENVGATFSAWYQIALSQALRSNEIKIPISAIKSLGDSEFSRLMKGQDLDIEAMIQSVEIHLGMLKSHKNLAQEKYKMAKDQVNASISNIAPPSEFGNEAVRLPKYQKLQERYGEHFKQPPLPEEEVDDDEPVLYKALNDEEDPEDIIIQNHVIDDAFKNQMADPEQDVVFEKEETEFSPAVDFSEDQVAMVEAHKKIVKRTVQEVSPIVVAVVDDPFLGKIKVEDNKVTKTEGKSLPPVEEDDDEPILFKKATKVTAPPKDFEVSASSSKDAIPVADDDDDFPAISMAQEQFKLKQVEKPAKGISPKPVFNDDDLEDII